MADSFLSDYADFHRSLTASASPRAGAGGTTAAEQFAAAMEEQGLDPSNPAAMAAASGADPSNPLTWAAMSVTQRTAMLPAWARDLKILGMGAMDTPEAFVYMRDYKVPGTAENPTQFDTPQGFREGNDASAPEDKTRAQSITRAKNLPYTWDEDEIDAAMKRMQDAGLDVTDFESLTAKWDALVDRAATTFMVTKGEKKVTPWDVLELIEREDETANGGEPDPNRRVTTTSRSVQDISEGEAWSTLQSNLSRMLGRDPSDQEVRDFTHRMNSLAAQNPSISKTVYQYKNGEVVSQNTTEVDSGFSADDMMMDSYEQAQKNPEYGAYQAASTYFNSAISALGAIGDV